MEYLPPSFLQESKSVQTKIIALGQHCWALLQSELESQKDLDQSALIRLWKEKGRSESMQTTEEAIQRVKREYQLIIEEGQREKTLLDRKYQKLEKDFEERITKAESQIQEKYIQDLQKERDHIFRESKLLVKEEISVLKEENIILKSTKDYKAAYDFLDTQYIQRVNEIDELKQKVDELTRVKSSYQLGKEGEGEIETMLKCLHEFDWKNVHAEPDKADFRLSKEKFTIILDSKKYSRAVPKIERDKIIDNTDKDALVCGGILLSLNSKISARQHCEIEITKQNKPILYLSFIGMTQDAKVHCLDMSLKLLLRLVQAHTEKERSELIEKVKLAFCILEEHKKKLENTKKTLLESVEHLKTSLIDVKQVMELLLT